MRTIDYADARDHLAALIDSTSKDREPITITQDGANRVVMLAIEEYEAMETTLHLFSSKANALQIQQGLDDYRQGKVLSGELCD